MVTSVVEALKKFVGTERYYYGYYYYYLPNFFHILIPSTLKPLNSSFLPTPPPTFIHHHNGISTASWHIGLQVVVAHSTGFQCQNRRLQWPAMLLFQNPGRSSSSFLPLLHLTILAQTLKERFAEQLPEKIEQIKKLRKYV